MEVLMNTRFRIKYVLLCMLSFYASRAVEDNNLLDSLRASIAPPYGDLFERKNLALENEYEEIGDNWNESDIDALLDEMECDLNEGRSLDKYYDPKTWKNKPVTNLEQLDRTSSLQFRMIHATRIKAPLAITDIRLDKTQYTLSEYQIRFLASLPHIRLFHLTCINSSQEIIPLFESLALCPLLSLHFYCPGLDDNVLLRLMKPTQLRSVNLAECRGISGSALKQFINSLSDTIEELYLYNTELTDEGLEQIARFQRVKKLSLNGCGYLSGSGLESLLANLSEGIEVLDLGLTRLTDEGLEQIARFRGLQQLSLGDCRSLSASALESLLANLPEGMEDLYLWNTQLADKGLEQIARFQRLKRLNVRRCRSLSGSGLANMLANLSEGMEELYLMDTQLTDKGLEQIARFNVLKKLWIALCTSLSGSGLDNLLARLPDTVEELYLSGTSLTIEGLNQISRCLGLKKLDIYGCPSLPSKVTEYMIWRLPEGLTFTDADVATRTIRKIDLLPPKLVNLSSCRLSSADLNKVLTFLPEGIEVLNLSYTALTDEGLEQIARFQRLKMLDIGGCRSLSGSAVKNILWQLPKGLEILDVDRKTRAMDKRMQECPRKEVGCGCTIS